MTQENSPSSPSILRENMTEGYLSQPRSILKLRENSTVPINSSQAERRVSFYNQVELRQFESTAGSSEETEAFTDPPEYFSSELDEHPEDHVHERSAQEENAGITIFEDPAESTMSTANDEETMELTGQLNAPALKVLSPSNTSSFQTTHLESPKNDSAINHGARSPVEATTTNPQLPDQTVSKQGPDADAAPSIPQSHSVNGSATPSRKSLDPQFERDDTANISFTMSPYQERQILFLPTMSQQKTPDKRLSNGTREGAAPSTEFRPIEALQEYADSLRDSLFNESDNLPIRGSATPNSKKNGPDLPELHNLRLHYQVSRDSPEQHANGEEDADMELTAPQYAIDTYEEVTMELTTRIAPSVVNPVAAGEDLSQTNEVTMELTQPMRTSTIPAQTPIGTSTQISPPQLQNDAVVVDTNTQSEEQPPNSFSPQASQNQDEATMELTEVHVPPQEPEAHMLSVVEEEEEAADEAEVPMDLTKPVELEADNFKTPVASGGSTPPRRQSYGPDFLQGVENVVSTSFVDRTKTIGSVDTPALMAAQKQFHQLIENSTPPYSRNRLSIGALGTPMHDPPPAHRLQYTKLPADDQRRTSGAKNDLVDFELPAETELKPTPAKRSLDPAIELKSSPSKKQALHSPMASEADALSGLKIPQMSFSKFLDEIDIKFFDDLDFATDFLSGTAVENESDDSYPKEDYYKAYVHVPRLEVYDESCKELKGKIEKGKRLYEELQETAKQAVPELFTKYYNMSYYEQMDIKSKFQTIQEYTREQAKQVWYEWRSKVFQRVLELVRLHLEVLKEDKLTLEQNIQELENEYELLIESLAHIKESIAYFKKIKEHYQDVDPEQFAKIKTELAALNGQLIEHKEVIRIEHQNLEAINVEIEAQKAAIAETSKRISDANRKLLTLKHFEPAEIESLKATSTIVQACAGLKFIESPSRNIYEFELHPKLRVTLDTSKADSADGLVFHPIDSHQKILYNETLEWYSLALAQTTPFQNIYETLSVFRQKWLKLLSIDEQIYALSIFYPIEFGAFNASSINFTLRFYSATAGLKIDYMVTIPLLSILNYQSSLLVTARILKSRQKATMQVVRDAICQQRKTHRLFSDVGDIELVT